MSARGVALQGKETFSRIGRHGTRLAWGKGKGWGMGMIRRKMTVNSERTPCLWGAVERVGKGLVIWSTNL